MQKLFSTQNINLDNVWRYSHVLRYLFFDLKRVVNSRFMPRKSKLSTTNLILAFSTLLEYIVAIWQLLFLKIHYLIILYYSTILHIYLLISKHMLQHKLLEVNILHIEGFLLHNCKYEIFQEILRLSTVIHKSDIEC